MIAVETRPSPAQDSPLSLMLGLCAASMSGMCGA